MTQLQEHHWHTINAKKAQVQEKEGKREGGRGGGYYVCADNNWVMGIIREGAHHPIHDGLANRQYLLNR